MMMVVMPFLTGCVLRSKASHLHRSGRALSLIMKQQKHMLAFNKKERQKERKNKYKGHWKTYMLVLLL
eukprot:11915305-Ditylum_brightwellii.AAC.1